MKLGGRVISNNNLEVVVIPRTDGDLVFKFKPVLDDTDFDTLVPMPKPPLKIDGDVKTFLYNDPDYTKSFHEYFILKQSWMYLKSIEATEDLVWETVDLGNPNTWTNFEKELISAGFTVTERNLMFQGFEKANSLSQEHLDKARESFLAGTRQSNKK